MNTLHIMTRPSEQSTKKKRTCEKVDFAIRVDYRVKLKENEKRDKYQDLTKEQKTYETWRWQWYQL